jgi:hypothetical protein
VGVLFKQAECEVWENCIISIVFSKQFLSFNVEQFFNGFSSHFLVVQFGAVLLDFMIAMAFISSR